MRVLTPADHIGTRPWGAVDVAEFTGPEGATVRLHWTNEPYVWHVNDGVEVFVVLDGAVDMHYRQDGVEQVVHLAPGQICRIDVGDEHVAHPAPEARVLVIERPGSI